MTTPDLVGKSGVICALRTFTCKITFVAHMTHDDTGNYK